MMTGNQKYKENLNIEDIVVLRVDIEEKISHISESVRFGTGELLVLMRDFGPHAITYHQVQYLRNKHIIQPYVEHSGNRKVYWYTKANIRDLLIILNLENKYQLPLSKAGEIIAVNGQRLASLAEERQRLASFTGEAKHDYYSCFISCSSQDKSFAQRLHADLQQKGVRCWFAPEDMKIGDKIRLVIDQSIRLHDKLLLIFSENSLNSVWVESEVEKAFEEEHQRGQTVVFPVRLDEAVMETEGSWAAEIRRTRHIGDFSRWKDHDAYQAAFERLLRDLTA